MIHSCWVITPNKPNKINEQNLKQNNQKKPNKITWKMNQSQNMSGQ